MLTALYRHIRAFLRRRARERDMREEMDFHLTRAAERLVARGLSPTDARAAARREFGNLGYLQEQARDIRGGEWGDALRGDLRFAWRHCTRAPLTTATIVVILAVGIGLNSALFLTMRALTHRPPPGIAADRELVRIRGLAIAEPSGMAFGRSFSGTEMRRLAEHSETFAAISTWSTNDVLLHTGTDPDGAMGKAAYVSPNYFGMLGVRLAAGNALPTTGEASGTLVAIINFAFWHDRFGGAPDAIGKTFRINDRVVTIAGVAPARFAGPNPSDTRYMVWLPEPARTTMTPGAAAEHPDSSAVWAVAQLRPGVTLQQATEVAKLAAKSDIVRGPGSRRRFGEQSADVVPLLVGNDAPSFTNASTILLALSGVTLLVLLVICATVSALLAGASVSRRREIAVRLSLGASRARLLRQLLTESLLLAAVGGALGLLLVALILRVFGNRFPAVELVPDWTTLAFSIGVILLTGVVFGLSPALHATRLGVAEVLKDAGSGVTASRLGLQRRLVVLQVALSQPLLVGLGALVAFLVYDAQGISQSPMPDRILVLTVRTDMARATTDAIQQEVNILIERLAAAPSIAMVAPYSGGYGFGTVAIVPADRDPASTAPSEFSMHRYSAAPGHFGVLGVPLVLGREFVAGDSQAVIIGSDLARELWRTGNPIGKRFRWSRQGREITELTVVGVFDARSGGANSAGSSVRLFMPRNLSSGGLQVFPSEGVVRSSMLARTHGPAALAMGEVQRLIRQDAPFLVVEQLATLADLDAEGRAQRMQVSGVAAGGGLLTLLLSSIGLYAVVALAVRQRLREIGVRMALGARPSRVTRLFFWQGLRLSTIGILLGLPLSVLALRMLGANVPIPKTALGVVIAAIAVSITALATWLPARRAAAVDPVTVLRAD